MNCAQDSSNKSFRDARNYGVNDLANEYDGASQSSNIRRNRLLGCGSTVSIHVPMRVGCVEVEEPERNSFSDDLSSWYTSQEILRFQSLFDACPAIMSSGVKPQAVDHDFKNSAHNSEIVPLNRTVTAVHSQPGGPELHSTPEDDPLLFVPSERPHLWFHSQITLGYQTISSTNKVTQIVDRN